MSFRIPARSSGRFSDLSLRACTASESRLLLLGVGDARQAIYGWRGGSAEILGRMEQDLAVLHGREPRCQLPLALGCPRYGERCLHGDRVTTQRSRSTPRCPTWRSATTPTKVTATSRLVELVTFPCRRRTPEAGDGEGEATDPLDDVVRRVREVQTRSRLPGRDFGILMRTNAAVHAMLDALRREGVDASGEGPRTRG